MTDVTPTELQAAIDLIRSGHAPIKLTAADILAACKLGIVGPAEAHRLLGLPDPPRASEPAKAVKNNWWQVLGL